MSSMNLIYNGDFTKTDGWDVNSNLNYGNGILRKESSLVDFWNTKFFPLTPNENYKLSFDIKFITKGSSSIYMAINPYDTNLNMISVHSTSKPFGSNCNTTLASTLSNGNTTVTLTSAANWAIDANNYRHLGICDNIAWGYKRCTKYVKMSSISGNTITLRSAWSSGSYAAGTKVSLFTDSNTYYYPYYWGSGVTTDIWTHYEKNIMGGDNIRNTCAYGLIGFILGSGWVFELRNLKLQCISSYQQINDNQGFNNTNFKKQGIALTNSFEQTSMPIRYIRDTTVGSTANSLNHYCQIKVFDINGINIAYNKKINGNLTVATDGIVNSSYLTLGNSGTANTGTPISGTLDLQHIFDVQKIIIWHYYPDGRTYYKNKTQVSVDGTNWITVYEGEKPQTAEGNIIYLKPDKFSIRNNGKIYSSQIYEY